MGCISLIIFSKIHSIGFKGCGDGDKWEKHARCNEHCEQTEGKQGFCFDFILNWCKCNDNPKTVYG